MSFLNALTQLLHGAEQAGSAGAHGNLGQAGQIAQHIFQGQPVDPNRPDFTYNPNPNTNIPYSSHNLAQVMAANGRFAPLQYAQLRLPVYTQASANSVGQGNQYVNSLQFPQLAQGGNYNPGFMPLQASNLSYSQGLQPTAQYHGNALPQANQFNPQNPINLY